MYHIIGGDGKEYGPVSTDQIRQWVTEGRANVQTQVRSEGATGWQSLGSVPELTSLFNAPPTLTATVPGAAATPGGVYNGDYELDIFDCVNRAWKALTANFWLMVGGCAIYLLIVVAISGCAQIPFIGAIFSIVSLIISGPLLGGVFFFMLRLLRGHGGEIGDVFAGFRDNLGQLILSYVVPTIITAATAIPGVILMVVPIVIMVQKHAANAGLIALASAGFLLMLVPILYLSICWSFTIPLAMDKRLDFWSAMKASRAQVAPALVVYFRSVCRHRTAKRRGDDGLLRGSVCQHATGICCLALGV
jgi:hypothetical protein